MKRRSDQTPPVGSDQLGQIIGLGEKSARKNYYPQLKAQIAELERFRSTMELASNAFLILKGETYEIVDANKAARDLLGISQKTHYIPLQFEDLLLSPIKSLKGDKLLFESLLYGHTEQETHMIFDFKWVKIEQEDYGILEGRDISDRKRAEKALQQARDHLEIRVLERTKKLEDEIEERRLIERALRLSQEELEEAIKQADCANAAKSQFLSNMSHELRTPLNGILGFAQLFELQSMPPLTEKQQEFISHIISGGKHLLELIDEILDLAKIEAGKVSLNIEDVNLGVVIDESAELIKPFMSKHNITFKVTENQDARAGFLITDRIRLRQVLVNLLSNAAKYNKENGSVFLNVEEMETEYCFEIIDTGKGISQDSIDYLFKPFSRLDHENSGIQGTGIGLTITKNLVELMNGRLEVSSQPGIGSTFTVYIPKAPVDRYSQQIIAKMNPPLEAETINVNPATVLYIEDNAANVMVLEELLKEIPDVVMKSAPTGEVGLELANAQQFDLILVDINLPGIDGFKVLSVLEEERQCPIFALSANAMEKDIEMGLNAGFDEYLIKPLNLTETIEKISGALNARH